MQFAENVSKGSYWEEESRGENEKYDDADKEEKTTGFGIDSYKDDDNSAVDDDNDDVPDRSPGISYWRNESLS